MESQLPASVLASVMKYRGVVAYAHQKLFSQFYGWKAGIKKPVWLAAGEGPLSDCALPDASSLTWWKKMRTCSGVPFLREGRPIDEGSTLMV